MDTARLTGAVLFGGAGGAEQADAEVSVYGGKKTFFACAERKSHAQDGAAHSLWWAQRPEPPRRRSFSRRTCDV